MTSYLPLRVLAEAHKGLRCSHAFLQQSFLMGLLCAKPMWLKELSPGSYLPIL